MSELNKTSIVQTLVGNIPEATSDLIAVYLADAQETILNRMYGFGHPSTVTSVPSQYDYLHCKLAARYILRRGAEGETSHNENGINRTYGSVNDEDLLREVMQVVKL